MKNLKWTALALISMAVAACDTKREEQLEERAEAREEAREDMAEQRELALRADERVTNEATATKGLQAQAVQQIAEARCARESRCGNIGVDEDYSSAEQCQAKISEEWRDELNAYDCPGGVVMKEFQECLGEIQSEDCSSPFDTLGRVMACRQSDICKAID